MKISYFLIHLLRFSLWTFCSHKKGFFSFVMQNIYLKLCRPSVKNDLFPQIAMDLWLSTGSVLTWLHKLYLDGGSFAITTGKVDDNGVELGLSSRICVSTFKNDIAHLTIDIAMPKVLEVERDIKVTFPGMLGTVGEICVFCPAAPVLFVDESFCSELS